MRFGAFIPQGWRYDLAGIPTQEHWPTMKRIALLIESLGFESAFIYDHFHTFPRPGPDPKTPPISSDVSAEDQTKATRPILGGVVPESHTVPKPTQEVTYEAWTLMAALAAVTDTVRLGQMCTCNSYRPPSYLAKVAANIDVISGGRVEMGIGAGWYEHEYLGYGYEFPKASIRIGMLREAVEIMQRMWTEEEVTYEGKHYQLAGAISQPKPVQKPHIPFWIAGGGEQLTLNVAARYASYTNFGGTVEEFNHKSEVLAGHCLDVGRDFESITRSTNFNIIIGETETDVQEKTDWIVGHLGRLIGEQRAERSLRNFTGPGGLVGTPEQIVETLQSWGAAGMDYAIVYFADAAYDPSSLQLFASQVAPELS